MDALFTNLSLTLVKIAIGLAGLAGAACLLAWVVLWIMNLWGIIDPRMGQTVKGGLLKVGISGAALAVVVAGGVALFTFS
jgi:hypothetical protein